MMNDESGGVEDVVGRKMEAMNQPKYMAMIRHYVVIQFVQWSLIGLFANDGFMIYISIYV
jgi:hypothetical protein